MKSPRRSPSATLATVLLGVLTPAVLAGTVSSQDALAPVERPAEDALVLALVLDRWILRDAVLAYSDAGEVVLPLGQMAAALDFAISVDPASGRAEGWFLAENRRFFLDVGSQQVFVEGKPAVYESSRIELHRDDIHVGSRLLARWWPVDFEVDLASMEVRVRGREKLPIEARRERQERQRNLRTHSAGPVSRSEHLRVPYLPASWPTVDGRLRVSASRSNGTERFETRHDLLLAGDLALMSAELFISGVDSTQPARGQARSRLRLGRRDPERQLLGVLRAREVAAGDLLTPDRPLVSRSRSALGLEISSFPLDRLSEPHRTDLRGEALPDWEVELYRNDELLAFQRLGSDGRYSFERVPLVQGLNVLRLAFYGPQEQRREEIRRLYVQPGSRSSQGIHYRLALFRQGRSLLSQDDAMVVAPDASGGDPRLFFELETPVGERLTLLAGLQSLTLEDGRHTYPSLGAAIRLGPLFGAVDLAADIAGGWAGRTLVQTRLGVVELLLEDYRFFDFRSEKARSVEPRSRTSLRAQGRLGRRRWGFLVEGQAERSRSGEQTRRCAARLAAPPSRLSASLDIEWQEHVADGRRRRRTDAGLLVSGVWGRFSLRGAAEARLQPVGALTRLSSTVEWMIQPRTSLSLDLGRNLATESVTSYGLGLARRFSQLSFGGGLSYEDTGSLSADISLSFSLGRDPHSKRWRTHWRPMGHRGAAAARVFLDRNGNGRMDGRDEPLSGVRLTRDGHATGVVTDEHGLAWLPGLTPFHRVELGLDIGSLEDPYWLPATRGVGLLPRPGRVARIELPVLIGGEIDGVVILRGRGSEMAAADVRVELLDGEGEVRRTTTTAFDGFYLFDAVSPGSYRVRIAPSQVDRLGLISPPVKEVVIHGEGSVIAGVDFALERAEDG